MLLAGATLSFGLTGYALQLYGYFTVVRGYGAIQGGLALAPLLALVLLTLRRSAALALEWEARRLIAGGLLVMGAAAAATALALPHPPPYLLLLLPLALFGYGCLAAQAAWTTAFVSAMPGAVVGATSGIMRATTSTGAAFGGAVLGTILLFAGRAELAVRLKDAGLSAEQVPAAKAYLDALLRAGFGRDVPVPPAFRATEHLLALYAGAFTTGVAATLLLTGAACVAMAALVWVVLEPRRAQDVALESPL